MLFNQKSVTQEFYTCLLLSKIILDGKIKILWLHKTPFFVPFLPVPSSLPFLCFLSPLYQNRSIFSSQWRSKSLAPVWSISRLLYLCSHNQRRKTAIFSWRLFFNLSRNGGAYLQCQHSEGWSRKPSLIHMTRSVCKQKRDPLR